MGLLPFCNTLVKGVIDHFKFYSKGGLHRDISSGNILIIPVGGTSDNTVGRLIDFDHAKRTETFHKQSLPTPDERTVKATELLLPEALLNGVQKEVIGKAVAMGGRHCHQYIEEVVNTRCEYFGMGSGPHSCSDLKWDFDVRCDPMVFPHLKTSLHI